MISLVLADDHQVVLEGLKAMLAAEPDLTVIGEAHDGLQVGPLVEKLRPEVLVVDLMMPGLNGLEVTRQLTLKTPTTRIVVLSMHSNDAYVAEALRNGAAGYVLKQAEGRQLVQAIRAVAGGARYLSPPLSAEAIDRYNAERSREDTLDPFDTLSTREREVLPLAAEGMTSAEIGKKLAIGRRTVETYRANLLRKLNLKSQAELVRYAVKRGLLPDE